MQHFTDHDLGFSGMFEPEEFLFVNKYRGEIKGIWVDDSTKTIREQKILIIEYKWGWSKVPQSIEELLDLPMTNFTFVRIDEITIPNDPFGGV